MKEIMAIVRMKKTGATKKALVAAGVAGFTAVRVLGRGKLVDDPTELEKCKRKLLEMGMDEISDKQDTEQVVTEFLDGSRFFPRRLFTVLAHDDDVPRIVEAITKANRTDYGLGDGAIFVLPVLDAYRVRTGEAGEAAIW
ncbi:nitrogen regulatory protein PII 2 [Methanolinea mesophila]|uniref:P-II family nitrogen regulator n=1 Tax=Methanolinea mesophila TaxID=547055 RepID=UPI001AE623BD|nr:P-II family nitrogen regulator [Methanolinea mesophila]MBP1928297.1 nitrogen regulatory protein PII 2 [Methanolinea mesophila]